MPESLKRGLMPPRTAKELKQFIFVHFPILSWFWSYQPKFLIGDITAGITVSVMYIPQGQWPLLSVASYNFQQLHMEIDY